MADFLVVVDLLGVEAAQHAALLTGKIEPNRLAGRFEFLGLAAGGEHGPGPAGDLGVDGVVGEVASGDDDVVETLSRDHPLDRRRAGARRLIAAPPGLWRMDAPRCGAPSARPGPALISARGCPKDGETGSRPEGSNACGRE